MKPALVAFVFLASCAPAVTYTPVRVEVPVEVPCKPPVVQHPPFPLANVPASASLFDKVKAALVELDLRAAYEAKLEASIKACGG